jgi:CO/xanthine dehydrogenase Mo-binding subunit
VRVTCTPLGGAFGSKLDNTVEALACLAAHLVQQPVKLTLSRPESIRVSTKRHAYALDYTVGLDPEGRILAVDARLLSDAGPYTALSPRVIDQACIFSCGPYRVPNLRVEGWAVHTNNANGSAFRGFGINQAAVAIESLLDEGARRLGLDPFELRLRNALGMGDATISGELLRASVATAATITAARDALTRQLAALVARARPGWRLGIGVASGFKNVGAGKGKIDDAGAILSLQPDGRILVRASAVDMGQGIRTALLQIASEVLGLPTERFDLITGDTARTIRHGGAVGERQTLIAGRALELAASQFAEAVLDKAAALTCRPRTALRLDGPTIRDVTGQAVLTLEGLAEQLAGRGEQLEVACYHVAPTTYALADAEARRSVPPGEYRNYPAYAYATQAAVVGVEEATGNVRVLKIVAAHDCGRAINPQKIEGQIEGSCLQGLGYALSEAYLLERGRPVTRTYRQLGVPSILATPEIEVILIEDPEPSGPFGAKGISEVATVPVTPAILNAIFDATGVRVSKLPADPAQIRAGMLAMSPHWWSLPSN